MLGLGLGLGLENAAQGLRPWAAFSRPRSQFFTIRTSQPANNIYLFNKYRSLACALKHAGSAQPERSVLPLLLECSTDS